MGIFEKMFGGTEERLAEVKAREARIERVKHAIKAKGVQKTHTENEKEAKEIQHKYGVSFEDALEYAKEEKKKAERKERIDKLRVSLGGLGERARVMTSAELGKGLYKPAGVKMIKITPPKKLDVFGRHR